jgi:uncharacterized protein
LKHPASNPPELPAATAGNRLMRSVFAALAVGSLSLGAIGVFVPGIPTTPFLLLACYFSAKSSPRIYRYIRESALFGPMVRDWQKHRGIRFRTKVHAIGFVVLGLAILALTTSAYPLWMACGLILGIIGIAVILRLPTI